MVIMAPSDIWWHVSQVVSLVTVEVKDLNNDSLHGCNLAHITLVSLLFDHYVCFLDWKWFGACLFILGICFGVKHHYPASSRIRQPKIWKFLRMSMRRKQDWFQGPQLLALQDYILFIFLPLSPQSSSLVAVCYRKSHLFASIDRQRSE